MKRKTKTKRNLPRDGSLSTGYPAWALDSLSGYHGSKKRNLGPKPSKHIEDK